MDAKFKGEEILRKSGLDYCVVRPGGLTDTSGGESLLAVGMSHTSKIVFGYTKHI